jgi:hypothetical protein
MLKQATLHPPYPPQGLSHPPTLRLPEQALGPLDMPPPRLRSRLEKNPQRTDGKSRSWPAPGGAGEMSVCLRFIFPAALLDDLFEHSDINRLSAA